jgi:hypothetical protein
LRSLIQIGAFKDFQLRRQVGAFDYLNNQKIRAILIQIKMCVELAPESALESYLETSLDAQQVHVGHRATILPIFRQLAGFTPGVIQSYIETHLAADDEEQPSVAVSIRADEAAQFEPFAMAGAEVGAAVVGRESSPVSSLTESLTNHPPIPTREELAAAAAVADEHGSEASPLQGLHLAPHAEVDSLGMSTATSTIFSTEQHEAAVIEDM